MKPRLNNIFTIICLLLLWTVNSFAAEEPYENFIKGAIKKNDSLFVKDEKFRNPSFRWSDITNISVHNTLSLSILSEKEIAKSFKLNVLLRVAYFSSPDQLEPTLIDSVKLNVNYEKGFGKVYKATDQYRFTDGYYVKVYVLDIQSPELGTQLPDIFQLSSTIVIDRTYQFIPGMPVKLNGVLLKSAGKSNGAAQRLAGGKTQDDARLELSWTPFNSAQEYDLEWVMLDKLPENKDVLYNLVNYSYSSGDAIVAEFFKNNSTRITTNVPNYSITLLSNADVILVRIRPVRYLSDGFRDEDIWSYKIDDLVNYAAWDLSWHENKMNWQYSASYAEEAKKKEVVTYFDGSLRGRQTVTLNNADEVALVQENIYDQYGRAAASILPAPAQKDALIKPSLHYFPKFNKSGNLQYNFSNLNFANCEIKPDLLNTSSGASWYYSANNQFKDDPLKSFNKLIPDADGLPLSVTQYTADNTGRIKLQGGVGAAFQPGIENSRTTKYFYGKPSQWELDRIFGNDVGYADHYLKNMVVDANQQLSVSYLNASGKTIATALAGGKPANVDSLKSLPVVVPDTIPLISAGMFTFNSSDLTLTANTTHLVQNIGPGVLKYDMEQLISRYPNNSFQPYSNCYYKLKITVKDDCQNVVKTQTEDVGSLTPDPNKNGLHRGSLDVNFASTGAYYITFEFSLNRDVITSYTDKFISGGKIAGVIDKDHEFILKELRKARFEDCLSDCKTARVKLGSLAVFKHMVNAKLATLNTDSNLYAGFIDTLHRRLLLAVDTLERNCEGTGTVVANYCGQYRTAMLADVSPGGQYALFDESGNPLEPAINVLLKGFKTSAYNVFGDLSADNQLYKDNLVTIEDKTTSPYAEGFNLKDLVKYWRTEWAELFLFLHPEYCKLQFCAANANSNSWNEKLRDISTDAGLLAEPSIAVNYNSVNNAWLIDKDPFFNNGGQGVAYKARMLADLAQYSSKVLKMNSGSASIKSLSQYVDYQLYCADLGSTTNQNAGLALNNWENCSKKGACIVVDREWQLYREMYLDLKQQYFELVRSEVGCPVACAVGAPINLPTDGNTTPPTCTSIINLGVTGVQISDKSFTHVSANTRYTYTLVSGLPNEIPAAGSICSSSPVFYPCLTITMSDGSPRSFFNVWMFTCTENITVPCAISGTLYVDGEISYGSGKYYVVVGPTNNDINEYTVALGDWNSMPAFDLCNGSYSTADFYDCLTIYHASGAHLASLQNVWVSICFNVYNPWSRSSMPRTLEAPKSALSETEQIIKDNHFVDSDKKQNEVIVTDVSTHKVYSIIKADSTSLSSGSPVAPGLKANFTKYEFRSSFEFQLSKKYFKKLSHVWVASYILPKNIQKPLVASKTADRSQNRGVDIPCATSDYWIAAVSNDGSGTWIQLESNRGPCNQNTPLSLYAFRNGSWDFIDIATIMAGNVTEWHYYSAGVLGSETWMVACGSSPCNPGTDPGGSCSPLLLTKKSRFETVNRTDVSGIDPLKTRNDVEKNLFELVRSTCDSNAVIWMERLKPGLDSAGKSLVQRNELKARLIEMCALAGDTLHPLGASSMPRGFIVVNGQNCRNFGDVIKAALNENHFTNLLNPWLLEAPYPYFPGHQPVERTITNTSVKICAALKALEPSPGASVPTFYNHLKTRFGTAMTMSQADFEILYNGCNNCRFILAKDVVLPQFLEPGAKTCITKAEYVHAIDSLKQIFSYTLATTSSNYEDIVSNYLNFKFGFSLTYDQYSKFITGSSEQLCNETPYTSVPEPAYACEKSLIEFAVGNGQGLYNTYIQKKRLDFENAYISTCASAQASVRLLSREQIYHYTLYYYDQAGNLIRTVPPEGVHILSKNEVKIVEQARRFKPDDFEYHGPTTTSNKTTALQSLSNTLAYGGNAAVEMWLYQNNSAGQQMIVTTPDMKYMFQACINGNLLNIDVYSLQQADPGSVSIVLSNHVTADIAALQPILPWTHIVVQGDRLSSGSLQLWINGKLYPSVSGAPSAGCGWSINSVPTLVMPENISSLKHIRLYPGRLMTAAEIKANAEDSALNPQVSTPEWYRFGVPAAGSNTTIAENSTLETQFNLLYPAHRLTTTYAYNSSNQVIKQESPDGGISRFWYDALGRLIISRNAKQLQAGKYSYTRYDSLGRITEVGEKLVANTTLSQQDYPDYLIPSDYQAFLSSGEDSEITQTVYDARPQTGAGVQTGLSQVNLRKRVAASIYRDSPNASNINASYYNYDIAGNVKTLYQQIAGLELKTIGYEYDLASGKVNFVSYQHGKPDQFYYAYKYDQENRLTQSWSAVQANVVSYGIGSSLDFTTRKLDAEYQYYLHGPLARMTLGNAGSKVQGLDYAYTLQGWLKGVNGNTLLPGNSQGTDGIANGVGRDAMAYSLGYYPGDYKPIVAGSGGFSMQWQPGGETGNALYNGNISTSTVAIKGINGDAPSGYTYGYDQLNRLVKMRQHDLSNSTSTWNSGSINHKYKETYTYDGNGNIRSLIRYGANAQPMDRLAYNYNFNGSGNLINNKLASLKDTVDGVNYPGELDGQSNYTYDAIGNLIGDSKENITSVDWTVYGKIKTITRNGQNISYTYDPGGNRVSKTSGGITTWYVRDAQGNQLGVYDNNGGVFWREQQLYGSSRLGMWRPDTTLVTGAGVVAWSKIGRKSYELSNHLGNVLAVVSDKYAVVGNDPVAELLSAQDYYPFGMIQPGRSLSSANYRYGFNGKENDNEVKGTGNQQDYGMRIYDPRVGRFLSVDPITKQYPELTPYQFASNRPIDGIDFDGLEYVGFGSKNKHDAAVYKTGMNNTDKSAVHIYSHGTPTNLMLKDQSYSSDVKDFRSILENSDVYKNAGKAEEIVVIIHACRTGRSFTDEKGNDQVSYAEKMSNAFPNLKIIAPDERNLFLDGKEFGPVEVTNMKNLRGDLLEGVEHKPELDKRGKWNVFKGGTKVGSFDGDTDVNTAPGLFDYLFKYKPNKNLGNNLDSKGGSTQTKKEGKTQGHKNEEKNKPITKDSPKSKI
jgi:RHS repeat-associated protein